MDTALFNGDHRRGINGNPYLIDGAMEIAQRASIRLSVRKGSFPLDKGLGSLLYTLRDVPKEDRDKTALSLARSALLDMGELEVIDARAIEDEGDSLRIEVELKYMDKKIKMEARV